METKKILYMSLGIVVGGLLVLGAGAYAGNGIGKDGSFFGKGFSRGCFQNGSGALAKEKPPFADKITKTVVNTASGAEITLTTTDSGALAFLQKSVENEKAAPKDAKILITKSSLVNGIKIVAIGNSAEEIKKIQENAAKDPTPLLGKGPKGPRGEGRGMGFGIMENIKKDVVNTASGIEVTMTTTDSGALAQLKNMAEFMKDKKPMGNNNVVVTNTVIDNGIKINVSSTDADTIKKIQENKNFGPGMIGGRGGMMGGGKGFGKKGGRGGMMQR